MVLKVHNISKIKYYLMSYSINKVKYQGKKKKNMLHHLVQNNTIKNHILEAWLFWNFFCLKP